MALAWGIGGGAGKTVKTQKARIGAGIYDRIADSVTLQSRRFDGLTQQSYLVNPNFFPADPVGRRAASGQPQCCSWRTVRYAPRNYQASVG